MESFIPYLILALVVVVLIVLAKLFLRAVEKAKKKQAAFEERFSKNYDRYPYRRPPWQ